MLYAGNDIVDLSAAEVFDKHLDVRFRRRVFTRTEQQMINRSLEPNRILWMLWASKETAYKIFSKIDPGIVFSPRRFRVQHLTRLNAAFFYFKIFYQRDCIDVKVYSRENFIHASAYFMELEQKKIQSHIFASETKLPKEIFKNFRKYFTENELQSIQRFESAWVRHMAKCSLSQRLNIPLRELEIRRDCNGSTCAPPRVFRKGAPMPVDLSLSHHGSWVAWVWGRVNCD